MNVAWGSLSYIAKHATERSCPTVPLQSKSITRLKRQPVSHRSSSPAQLAVRRMTELMRNFFFPPPLCKHGSKLMRRKVFPWNISRVWGEHPIFLPQQTVQMYNISVSSNEHHYSWIDAVPNELIEFLKRHSYLKQAIRTLNLHQKSAWDSHHCN